MKKWLAVCVVALVAAIAAAVLIDDRVMVDLKNVGAEPMLGVVVHVTGASYPVGDLAPGASVRVPVQPKGESHVEIAHSTGQRLVVDCYLESGYTGTLEADVTSAKFVATRNRVKI